jgi:MOSC domain-containing protein YiiM
VRERVVSVNVGRPVAVPWRGKTIRTGIFKAPIEGRAVLRATGFDGDGQADLTVHGGVERAAYCYSADAYARWSEELGHAVRPGEFGENLTVTGLTEDEVAIGDVLRAGEALIQVASPREPCFKLGIRMGDHRFPKRFRDAGRTGFYVRVLEEGSVGAGDPVERVAADRHGVTVAEIHRLFARERGDVAGLRRAAAVPALPEEWRRWCLARIAEAEAVTARRS